MKLIFIFFILFICVCDNCFSLTIINNINGNKIDGLLFSTHDDYGNDNDYICASFKNFDDNSLTSGSWEHGLGGAYSYQWSLESTINRTGSTYSAKKRYIDSRLGALSYTLTSSVTKIFVSYWYYPDSSLSDGEKFTRIYYTDGSNTYMGANSYYLNWKIASCGESQGPLSETRTEWSSKSITPNTWQRVSYFIDFTGSGGQQSGVFKVWINGELVTNATDILYTPNTFEDAIFQIGNMINSTDGAYYVFDDVYLDHTQARVEIGNNSVYSNCDNVEIQIPTAWSDTSISITYNNGSFVPGDRGYLFVIDSDGNASAGYDLGTLQSDGTWGNLKPVQATNLTMSNVTVGE